MAWTGVSVMSPDSVVEYTDGGDALQKLQVEAMTMTIGRIISLCLTERMSLVSMVALVAAGVISF